MKKVNYVVPSTEVLAISALAMQRNSGMVDDTTVNTGIEGKAPRRSINIMYI